MYEIELRARQLCMADAKLARSMANTVESDAEVLAELAADEERAAADRRMAMLLERAVDVQGSDGDVGEVVEGVAGLAVSGERVEEKVEEHRDPFMYEASSSEAGPSHLNSSDSNALVSANV